MRPRRLRRDLYPPDVNQDNRCRYRYVGEKNPRPKGTSRHLRTCAQFLVHEPELLVISVVRHLYHKHRPDLLSCLYLQKRNSAASQASRAFDQWALELHFVYPMFVNEFVFSFSLLGFAAILLVIGALLIGDGLRRLLIPERKPKVKAAAPAALSYRPGSQGRMPNPEPSR